MIKKILTFIIISIFFLPQLSKAQDFQGLNNIGKINTEITYLKNDLLQLDIFAQDFQVPVLGVSFQLQYSENLKFISYEPGEFLEIGGDPFYLVKDREDLQKVIFGSTLKSEDFYPMGSGLIASIIFEDQDSSKTTSLVFNKAVVSTEDEVRQDLDYINWQNIEINEEGEIIKKFTSATASYETVQDKKKKRAILLLFIGIIVASVLMFVLPNFLFKK
jgi:hypothetical protein